MAAFAKSFTARNQEIESRPHECLGERRYGDYPETELAEWRRVELSSRREHMPDDLTNKGPQDPSRISLLEPHEVQYWADKFNVSKERLSEAVRNVGHSAAAVEKELKKLA
jgi:Protein of unknown function (DUF3606)